MAALHCQRPGCYRVAKVKWCSESCAAKTRRAQRKRAHLTCARDGCSKPVGERQRKFCSRDCKVTADRYTNACADCQFPIHRNHLRCRSCFDAYREANPSTAITTTPESIAKMKAAAINRYAEKRNGIKWTEPVIEEIRRRHEEGVSQSALAKEYKCGKATVWALVTFGGWAGYREFKKQQIEGRRA